MTGKPDQVLTRYRKALPESFDGLRTNGEDSIP
jgi:hypothetical protein